MTTNKKKMKEGRVEISKFRAVVGNGGIEEEIRTIKRRNGIIQI